MSLPGMGPSFDTLGGAVQHPGTMRMGATEANPEGMPQTHILRPAMPTQQRASDKFAIITMTVDATKPYQLLPVDPLRKSAVISCLQQPIFIADMSSISNILGYTSTGTVQPPGVLILPVNSTLTFNGKASLWICSAAAGGAVAWAQCIVEKYDIGTPVT